MKYCKKCNKEYSSERCRTCVRCYNRKYKKKHKNKLLEIRLGLYHNDIGKSGKTIITKRTQKYMNSHKIIIKAKRAFKSMLISSRKNNIPFEQNYFTIERLSTMIAESKFCPCCGVRFVVRLRYTNKIEDDSVSFDRFIPQLGYVKGNVLVICWRCNNLKRDATAEELFKVAEWMVKTRSAIPNLLGASLPSDQLSSLFF